MLNIPKSCVSLILMSFGIIGHCLQCSDLERERECDMRSTLPEPVTARLAESRAEREVIGDRGGVRRRQENAETGAFSRRSLFVSVMDTERITKRLHVSGLTPSITTTDLTHRLSKFGTVKDLDGFGKLDALGQPRKFGYVTLEGS